MPSIRLLVLVLVQQYVPSQSSGLEGVYAVVAINLLALALEAFVCGYAFAALRPDEKRTSFIYAGIAIFAKMDGAFLVFVQVRHGQFWG